MTKREVSAKELVDRLLEEDPASARRFIEVIRNANALELEDPDLLLDWLSLRDDMGNVMLADEEIEARMLRYQSLVDALKPKTLTAKG
jgi:hypothetical protein